jgi:hypothetical protein
MDQDGNNVESVGDGTGGLALQLPETVCPS